MPDHAWFETGKGLLYDQHPEPAQRTLESLDPATGARRKLVDSEKSLKLMNAMFKPEEPYEELGWPSALDPQGGYAAYVKEDDLMLLDLGSGEWVRVTETDDVVKSPRFSLDGKLLAYVRGNDLYVWEIRTRVERRLTEDGTGTLLNGTVSWVYWEEIFGRNDQGYEWSPDSKSIAYLQTDESGVGLVSFIDFEPNVPEVINQRYPKTGEANPRVHPQNAWRFADELIDANIMFDMMIYPMRKHGIEDDEAQQHLYSTMLEFWDRNLKGVGHQESKQEYTNSW